MITFIVSTYQRPALLKCCLASLRCQTMRGDIIVCDNEMMRPVYANEAETIAHDFGAFYVNTSGYVPNTCYHNPLTIGAKNGEWYCFPSDDSYYVPEFSERMLALAVQSGWGFAYCDVLYDPRITGGKQYAVLDVQPKCGRIDKTCFIIHREAFKKVGGWPAHANDWRDGALAEAVVRAGIKHGKVPGPMCVHN